MDNGFWFNGHHTGEFSMFVEKIPAQKSGARKRTTVSIPGRNGNLHLDEGTYENYTQPYDCYFHGSDPTPEQSHVIKSWLLSAAADARLEDAYDPDYFRLATYSGPLDVENILNEYGRCKILFDCDPRFFLKNGAYPQLFTAAGSLYNTTAFPAKPIITVYGSGSGTVTVGGVVVEIKSITDQITLDCELMDAYRKVGEGAIENMNGRIYAPVFPELAPGENVVSWTGGITSVEIIPRWWTL